MRIRTRTNPGLGRPGVAATELAIWLPFLVLMFAVAVDFCRIYFTTQTVQNCACAGAMYASGVSSSDPATSPSDAAIQAAVAEGTTLSPALDASNVTVAASGSNVVVTVTYDFTLLTKLPGLGQKITITRTVTMASLPAPGT
jgi:Flp pilus assembly protein TadG